MAERNIDVPSGSSTQGEFTKQVIPDGKDGTIEFLLPSHYVGPFTLLGIGSSGSVCSAMDSTTGNKVAIKRFGFALFQKKSAKELFREIKIVSGMKHENVIGMTGVFRPPDTDEVYVVYDHMETDLEKIIASDLLTEDHTQRLLYQLLEGVRYIHLNGVVHRDLKPANILVNMDDWKLKITDFGFSRIIDTSMMTPHIGSISHMAPEMLMDSWKYTAAIDMWSIGCIFGNMLIKESVFSGPPFDYGDQLIRVNNELGGVFSKKFAKVPPDALDLVQRLLDMDPETRITAKDALAHPYLKHQGTNPVLSGSADFDYEELSLHTSDVEDIEGMIQELCLKFNQH